MLQTTVPADACVGNHFVIIAQFTISGDSKLGRLILKFSVISCDAGI